MSSDIPNSESFQLSTTTANSARETPERGAVSTQPAPAESPAPNRLKSTMKMPSGS